MLHTSLRAQRDLRLEGLGGILLALFQCSRTSVGPRLDLGELVVQQSDALNLVRHLIDLAIANQALARLHRRSSRLRATPTIQCLPLPPIRGQSPYPS